MNTLEIKLSDYIDALNSERKPEEHRESIVDPESEKIMAAVGLVRTLREPVYPDPGYPDRLAETVAAKISKKRLLLPSGAALIAGLLLFAALISWTTLFKPDAVKAMEKAVAKLSNYHGVLEMRTRNAEGDDWLIRRAELWTEGDKYAVLQNDGTLTVNNGEQKWQVRPGEKIITLLPLVPDPNRNSFDLRDEAAWAIKYPHTVVGSEAVEGRQTTKLEILPPGGMAYWLWIDTETNLPVQLQTAQQNALQTTYTYISFEPNTQIDPEIFRFQNPEGYKVTDENPGQLVATVEEAAALSQITPLLAKEAPIRIFAYEGHIILDHGDTTIVEKSPEGPFRQAANSALGSAAGGQLEVGGEHLRWRQNGQEIQVEGLRRLE
jgi:outer membrane lipoprotein-sorting protein